MPNRDKKRPDKIIVTTEKSIAYWCELLNCEKADLLHALGSIGYSFEAVDSFLILNRKKKIKRRSYNKNL